MSVIQCYFFSICPVFIGKHRIARKPNSKSKFEVVLDLKEGGDKEEEEGRDEGSIKGVLTEEELWARLDELERLEELQEEQDRWRIIFRVCFHRG